MIDAHAHLDDAKFRQDVDAVVARASAAGVDRILSCGDDLASSERTVLIARRHPSVRVAVGVHPHHAESWTPAVSAMLERLARDGRVVAIGEIGLDRSGRSAPLLAQETAFSEQLALARRLDLPVVVHIRDAGGEARSLIDRAGGARGMVHCYSEGPDEIVEWTRRDFAISFAGTLTYPRSHALREAAVLVPPDRLLVETDAPYLPPQRHRGERNEPAFVLETLAPLAALRRVEMTALASRIGENARKLFGDRF